ncbi:MAG: hypothetical protein ACRDTG_27330 [Pseudonocardiaceae bacterium]
MPPPRPASACHQDTHILLVEHVTAGEVGFGSVLRTGTRPEQLGQPS